jgi:transcriptional regulator with XRE-family HTH domain
MRMGTREKDNPFVEWLRAEMERREMSLWDLAEKIGDKSPSALYRILNRERNLGEMKARQIADALGIEHGVLFSMAQLISDSQSGRVVQSRQLREIEDMLMEIGDQKQRHRVLEKMRLFIKMEVQDAIAEGRGTGDNARKASGPKTNKANS